jgi:hypothetical protein
LSVPNTLPPRGSRFQTALGFSLTIVTVQVTPAVAAAIGWPALLAIMALGPFAGIAAMMRLRWIGSSALNACLRAALCDPRRPRRVLDLRKPRSV